MSNNTKAAESDCISLNHDESKESMTLQVRLYGDVVMGWRNIDG